MSKKTEVLKTARFQPGQMVYFKGSGGVLAKIGSLFSYKVAGEWQLRYALLVPHQSGFDRVVHAVESELSLP